MSSPNPFKLQTDNKRFFFDVVSKSSLESVPQYGKFENATNRIKNMSAQLEQLAKKRQQMLFKDSQIDYIFKKEKPAVQLGDFITSVAPSAIGKDKKFRVRALLKQKKQSVHEFLEKKKEIYLSKMNINIKKQQTTKLEDSIKDEEETLKARKLYFENDVQFMHKFIEGIKKQAEDAQSAVQSELKVQESLVSKLNSIQAETEKIDNLISKDTEVLNNLKTYKQFIDAFHDQERNWKPYQRKQDDPLFVTENDSNDPQNLVILYQPENLLEIFNNAEENNIREMQNLHDKEDEVEVIIKAEKKEGAQLDKVNQQFMEKISLLERSLDKKMEESSKLKDLKKNNINKISILDNENLDLEKVAAKIYEIFKDINSKKASQTDESSIQKMMIKAMTEIEHEVEVLKMFMRRQKEAHPQLNTLVEKEMFENQRKETLRRNKEQAIELEYKKQREQEKKRNQPVYEKVKGRKDMQKVIIEKKVVKKKQVESKNVDESQKYFTND